MKKEIEEELLLLSRDEAVQQHFRIYNEKSYKWFLYIMFFSQVFAILVRLPEFFVSANIVTFTAFVLYLALLIVKKKRITKENFYHVLIFFLVLTFFVLFLDNPRIWEVSSRERYSHIVSFAVILVFFRLRVSDHLYLYGAILFIGLFDIFVPATSQSIAEAIALITVIFFIMMVALGITRRRKKKFLASWEKDVEKHRERLRMKQELEAARKIQLSILPQTIPEIKGLEISSSSIPANEVGGDYYDFFPVSEEKLSLVTGDVSGHGFASGIVLSGARSGIYLLNKQLSSPKDILAQMNRMMVETTDKKMFMTLVYATFDMDKQYVRLANAGHTPVLHYSADKGKINEIRLPALPLGSMMSAQYKEVRVSFKTNDIFLFYSDGLTEAKNADDKLYNEVRFMEKLAELFSTCGSAREIRDTLLEDVFAFFEGEEQGDDITLVVVKIT